MPTVRVMTSRIRRIRSARTAILPGHETQARLLGLDREAFKERLWIEQRMIKSSARLMHFFVLLTGYLFCLTSHQPIQMVSQVHRRLSRHYGLDDLDALEHLDGIDKAMEFLQSFAQRTYDLSAAIIDVTTLDRVDVARCFWGLRRMDKLCFAKYWDLPIRFPLNPNYLEIEPLIWDRISRSNMDSVKICKHHSDRAHDDRCIDGREMPLGQVDPQYQKPLFGLTPEYPLIFDPSGDFQGSSHAVLMPIVWQVRSPEVPCSHFHRQYNDDILGAGRCQPDQPCKAKSASFVARQKHWETNRTMSIYMTYGSEIMKCVDRSKHTSTFRDKSFDSWATFSDFRRGKEVHSTISYHGRPVFYKFFSDIASLQAPVPEGIYINTQGNGENCNVKGYDPIPSACEAPLLDPQHPMWLEESSAIYFNRTSMRRVFQSAYYNLPKMRRRNTYFTRETSELTVAAFIITPQPDVYREIITIVRVTFTVSQGGEIRARPSIHSVTQCYTWWYVLASIVIAASLLYMAADMRSFCKMHQDYVNRLFVQRLAIYMDLFMPLLTAATLVWMVVLDETSGGGKIESYLADAFATATEESYFKAILHLGEHHESVVWLNKFGFFVGILQIIRLILYFGMHPRLAVLVDTVRYAADEMWHFTIIFFMLFFVLALTAYWMFGQEREHFSSPSQACWTQLGMFIGEYGFALPEDTPDVEFIIYQLVFIFCVFLILLNFFLAIVVEAYAAVRRAIEECEVEDELIHDFIDIVYTLFLQTWLRWPAGNQVHKSLIDHHEKASATGRTVGADFLYENVLNKKGDRLFKNHAHATEYVDFYAEKMEKYGDFVVRPVLEPTPVVPDGCPPTVQVDVQELQGKSDAEDQAKCKAAADSVQAFEPDLETKVVSIKGAFEYVDDTTPPETPRGDMRAPYHGRTRRMVEMLDQLTCMTRAHGDELMRAAQRIEELESENEKLREELDIFKPKPATLMHIAAAEYDYENLDC